MQERECPMSLKRKKNEKLKPHIITRRTHSKSMLLTQHFLYTSYTKLNIQSHNTEKDSNYVRMSLTEIDRLQG